MLKRVVTAAVLFIAVFGCCAPAFAAPSPVIHLTDESQRYSILGNADVLDDPTGNLDIDDVAQSRAFHSASADSQPPWGEVRWYRFRLDTPPTSAGRWYIVTWNYCDDADLYEPRAGGRFSHQAFGFRTPFALRPAPGMDPALRLPVLGGPLFVRLQCLKYPQSLAFESASRFSAGTLDSRSIDVATIAMILLTFVSLGLALVTRSRLYALVALTAATGTINIAHYGIARWFPHASFPFYLSLYEASNIVLLLAQWYFYENFFSLDRMSPQLRLALRAATALCILIGLAQYIILPAQVYATLPIFSPTSDLLDFVQGVWYLGVGVLAISYARAGNRSAWFVAVGALGFGIASYATDMTDFFPALAWMSPAWDFAFPFDVTMFILGVGDQLRQTARSRQEALVARDEAQSSLLTEQGAHIADVERHNTAFARYVPREFLAHLDRADVIEVTLGDHIERDMAVLFADMRGFTALSERLSSQATFDLLNAYFARAGPVIREHGGFIDKYVGDAIVALFPNRPSDALDTAIALQSEVRRFNEDRARRGEEPIAVGIGMNYGSMLLGTVGESERYETTVIADSVNIASRLEGLTKIYGVAIIASRELVEALDDEHAYSLRPLGELELRGHQRTEGAYELFDGDAHDLMLQKRRSLEEFTSALAAYTAGDYDISYERFAAIVAATPADTAATYLRNRSAVLRDAAPPPAEQGDAAHGTEVSASARPIPWQNRTPECHP